MIKLHTHSNASPSRTTWTLWLNPDGRLLAHITNLSGRYGQTVHAEVDVHFYRDLSDLLEKLEHNPEGETKVGLAIKTHREQTEEFWRIGLSNEYSLCSVEGRIWALVEQLRGGVLNNGVPESGKDEPAYLRFQKPPYASTSADAWDVCITADGRVLADIVDYEAQWTHTVKTNIDIRFLQDLSDLLDELEPGPEGDKEVGLSIMRRREGAEEKWRLGLRSEFISESVQSRIWAWVEQLRSHVLNNVKAEWYIPFFADKRDRRSFPGLG